jgi:hypothetical protein
MHISTRVLPICLLSLAFGLPVANSAHAQQESTAADTTEAQPQEESASGDTTAVQPGVQGAPNPLQDNVRLVVGQDLIDESFPSSIPIPGTDVRFKIGGYAKLDYIQDFDPIGSRYEFESATIPVEGTPEAELGGRTTLHAKETRFNFDVRTVVTNEHYGWTFPLRVFMEWDFFEDNPDLFRQPRLRQAFGVVGRFLAGQTWSINADLEALPGNIDFGGGDGVYGDRVAQIRWQDKLGERLRWTVGVEEPKSQIANPFDLEGSSRQTLPNFAGALRWTSAGGTHLQVGADLFQLRWQGGETGPDATAMGFGVNLTGRILLDSNNTNTILFGTSTGLGSSHRVLLLEFEPNDAVVTADDGLDVTSHWQGYAGFSHYWNESFNSTVSLYYARLNNSEFQSGDNIHDGGTFHINLIWFPYKYVSTGIEYMRGLRRNKDGAEGTANRVQLMAKFKIP